MRFLLLVLTICLGACDIVCSFCTNMTYTASGSVDIFNMLQNCAASISGSYLPPSYFSNQTTTVNASILVNSLLSVDDVTAEVRMDIYLRNYWLDPRIQLPTEFWSTMNPAIRREGIEISSYISDGANPLRFWLPDIAIQEAVEQGETVSELIRLFEDGHIFWSRHLLITVKESQMDLHDYPADSQNFLLTLQSFAYSSDFVLLSPIGDSYVAFGSNPLVSESLTVELNNLWEYESFNYKEMEIDAGIFFDPVRQYSTVTITLTFQRKPYGLLFRLAFPVLIFLIIVGFTFWADPDKRVDIAVGMLFAVAALYVVVGQIIPFVGYFTNLDLFITTAVVMLCGAILIHFMVYRLIEHSSRHPVYGFMSNVLNYFCRTLFVPFTAIMAYGLLDLQEIYFWIALIILSLIPAIFGFVAYPKALRDQFWISYDLSVLMMGIRQRPMTEDPEQLKANKQATRDVKRKTKLLLEDDDPWFVFVTEAYFVDWIKTYIEPIFRPRPGLITKCLSTDYHYHTYHAPATGESAAAAAAAASSDAHKSGTSGGPGGLTDEEQVILEEANNEEEVALSSGEVSMLSDLGGSFSGSASSFDASDLESVMDDLGPTTTTTTKGPTTSQRGKKSTKHHHHQHHREESKERDRQHRSHHSHSHRQSHRDSHRHRSSRHHHNSSGYRSSHPQYDDDNGVHHDHFGSEPPCVNPTMHMNDPTLGYSDIYPHHRPTASSEHHPSSHSHSHVPNSTPTPSTIIETDNASSCFPSMY